MLFYQTRLDGGHYPAHRQVLFPGTKGTILQYGKFGAVCMLLPGSTSQSRRKSEGFDSIKSVHQNLAPWLRPVPSAPIKGCRPGMQDGCESLVWFKGVGGSTPLLLFKAYPVTLSRAFACIAVLRRTMFSLLPTERISPRSRECGGIEPDFNRNVLVTL